MELFPLPVFHAGLLGRVLDGGELSSLAWLLGLVLGFGLASAKQAVSRWLSAPAAIYVWFFAAYRCWYC